MSALLVGLIAKGPGVIGQYEDAGAARGDVRRCPRGWCIVDPDTGAVLQWAADITAPHKRQIKEALPALLGASRKPVAAPRAATKRARKSGPIPEPEPPTDLDSDADDEPWVAPREPGEATDDPEYPAGDQAASIPETRGCALCSEPVAPVRIGAGLDPLMSGLCKGHRRRVVQARSDHSEGVEEAYARVVKADALRAQGIDPRGGGRGGSHPSATPKPPRPAKAPRVTTMLPPATAPASSVSIGYVERALACVLRLGGLERAERIAAAVSP